MCNLPCCPRLGSGRLFYGFVGIPASISFFMRCVSPAEMTKERIQKMKSHKCLQAQPRGKSTLRSNQLGTCVISSHFLRFERLRAYSCGWPSIGVISSLAARMLMMLKATTSGNLRPVESVFRWEKTHQFQFIVLCLLSSAHCAAAATSLAYSCSGTRVFIGGSLYGF